MEPSTSNSCASPSTFNDNIRHHVKNITSCIEKRRNGVVNKEYMKKTIMINTIVDLTVSKHVEFDDEHASAIQTLDVDRNGQYLLSGDQNGTVMIYDMFYSNGSKVLSYPVTHCGTITGELPPNCPVTSIESIQWYPFDSGMFITGGEDRCVRLWDTNVMKTHHMWRYLNSIYQIHMSPANTSSPLVAVATTASEVKIVDLVSGNHSHELRGHTSCVLSCKWSPTNPYLLATGGYDSTIRIWDVRSTCSCLAILNKNLNEDKCQKPDSVVSHKGLVNGLQFTPNGRLLISLGSDDQVYSWDMGTFKRTPVTFEPANVRKGRSIDFATCGSSNHSFCFVPEKCKISVYRIDNGRKINSLFGHYDRVNACYFNEHRMELYSAGSDRNILHYSKKLSPETEEMLTEGEGNRPGPHLDWE